MTVTQRNATTVYSLSNSTILDVYNLSSPAPTNYSADLFLQTFDIGLFAGQVPDSGYDPYRNATQAFLELILTDSAMNPSDPIENGVELWNHLLHFMATPILVYNLPFINGEIGGESPTSYNYTGALGISGPRVNIQWYKQVDGS